LQGEEERERKGKKKGWMEEKWKKEKWKPLHYFLRTRPWNKIKLVNAE